MPDGTIIWTSPTGHTYTTRPGAQLYFPDWDVRTAVLPPVNSGAPQSGARAPQSTARGLQMPRRARTRQTDRIQRIKTRRAQNDTS